jgi:hypothetical protein
LANFPPPELGLEDQMLGIVVSKERGDLQEAKEMLVTQNARQEAETRQNIPLQEKCHREILKGVRNISDTL